MLGACLWRIGGTGDIVQDIEAAVWQHAPHIRRSCRAQQHHAIKGTCAILRIPHEIPEVQSSGPECFCAEAVRFPHRCHRERCSASRDL